MPEAQSGPRLGQLREALVNERFKSDPRSPGLATKVVLQTTLRGSARGVRRKSYQTWPTVGDGEDGVWQVRSDTDAAISSESPARE